MRKNCINFKCNVLIIFPSLLEQTIKVVLSKFHLDKRCAKGYLVKIKDGRGGGVQNKVKGIVPIFLPYF